MMRLSKNDDSSLCYDVVITHQNFIIDKFGDFSSDFNFKTKMDIFRDDISLIINQFHLQATEGSLRRTRSVCQPRSASKRIYYNLRTNGRIFTIFLKKRSEFYSTHNS